ncbi:hypothetical protein D1N74_20830, partial [Clostridioides difficile]
SRLCFFGIPAFQFPFLLHTGKRITVKLRVFGGHFLKIHIGPGETGQDRGKTGSEEAAGACEERCSGSPHRSMVLSPQQNPR